jgi:hypothetical protein
VLLAQALAADGQLDVALAELAQARAAFDQLGAAPDAQHADASATQLDAARASQPAGSMSDVLIRDFLRACASGEPPR